jgi:2-polyprenyl-3-methyl-5-hydroxy-6-metoxy-1,4-benzoquinol methylase
MSLATRSTAAELMDDLTDPAEYARCLADLAQVNTITLARRPTLAFLDGAMRQRDPGEAISVFDVAFGHGDMLRTIARWAQRRGRPVRLGGIDLNPGAAVAARAASAGMQLELATGNVLTHEPAPAYDYIISSLFTHHLDNAQIVAFLRWMERNARFGWFVNDLHRQAFPYYGFPLLGRVLGWHRIVRSDGQVSIARSFRRAEWQALLAEAGVPGQVQTRFPSRLCVTRLR